MQWFYYTFWGLLPYQLLGGAPVILAGLILLYLGCRSWGQPRSHNALGRWSRTLVGAGQGPTEFYATLYDRFKSGLSERSFPFAEVRFGPRHLFATRTIFGPRPLYLELRYQHLTFYLFATHAPGGLFVSHWTFAKPGGWLRDPWLRWLWARKAYGETLFQHDVTVMFLDFAHRVVMETIDSCLEEQGLAPLQEMEKRPLLQPFYATASQLALPVAGAMRPLSAEPFQPVPVQPMPVQSIPVTDNALATQPVLQPASEPLTPRRASEGALLL